MIRTGSPTARLTGPSTETARISAGTCIPAGTCDHKSPDSSPFSQASLATLSNNGPSGQALMKSAILAVCLSLVWLVPAPATPVFTVAASGHEGFDVYADGSLAAPIRLAANGAIVADTVQTNASGLRLSALRAKDSAAVTFAADDFVSITLPAANSTNLAWEPVVQFKLTVRTFDTNKWLALFPGAPAPFHFLVCSMPTAKVWHQIGWLHPTPATAPL